MASDGEAVVKGLKTGSVSLPLQTRLVLVNRAGSAATEGAKYLTVAKIPIHRVPQQPHSKKLSIPEILEGLSARAQLKQLAEKTLVSENINFIEEFLKLQKALDDAQLKEPHLLREAIEQDKRFQEQFQSIYSRFILENGTQWISISGPMRHLLDLENNGNSNENPTKTSFKFASFKQIYDDITTELEAPLGTMEAFNKSYQPRTHFRQDLSLTHKTETESETNMRVGNSSHIGGEETILDTQRSTPAKPSPLSTPLPSPLVFSNPHETSSRALSAASAGDPSRNLANPFEHKNTIKSLIGQLKEFLQRNGKKEDEASDTACCFRICGKSSVPIDKEIRELLNYLEPQLTGWINEKIEGITAKISLFLKNHEKPYNGAEQKIVQCIKDAHKKLMEYKGFQTTARSSTMMRVS